MKYLLIFVVTLSVLASCKKADTSNAQRFEIIGSYHFIVVKCNYQFAPYYTDTTRYDGRISLLNPDDGSHVAITYPDSGITILVTHGNSLEGGNSACRHGRGLSGEYRDSSIFIQDYQFACETNMYGFYYVVTGTKY